MTIKHNLPLQTIFNQGYRDFYRGDITNPYPRYIMKAKEWERGFNRAYFDNLTYLERINAKQQPQG